MSFILGGISSKSTAREQSDSQLIKRLWQYLRGHHWKLGLVVLVLFVNSLSVTLIPMALGHAIDGFSSSSATLLWIIVAALSAFALLTWLTQYAQERLTSSAVADVTLRAQTDTLKAALNQDHAFYDRNTSGGLVSRITTDTSTLSGIVNLSASVLNQLILVILLSAVLIVISPVMALIVSSIVPLVILIALVFRRMARRAATQAQRSIGEINAKINETMRGIAVAKNYRQEAMILEEFRKHNRRVYAVSLANNRIFGGIFPLLDIVTGLGVALVLYLGGRMVLEGDLTAGTWYLGVQAVTLLLFPLTGIASFWSQFQQGLAATERVSALVDAEPRVKQLATTAPTISDARVRFENVNLRYTDDRLVLENLSLDIPSGQRIALIGRTGSGKTSLLRTLMRFYEYEAGRVTIGGVDLRSIPFDQLGNVIGLVPQTPMLFDGTVADNIRFARPDASPDEILAAAHAVGTTWLEELSKGLETPVGERGALLSQGQRQLVTLARVMLQHPAVVLLDEATANVDSFSELQLQQGFDAVMRGRTTIIVAHRLATVMHTERVVILERGQIIGDGTHQSLLKSNADYALFNAKYFGSSADEGDL
jgi:ATP-binding cassette, subfamily B, bacterial